MRRTFLRSTGAYVTTGGLILFVSLAAWAVWGSPSMLSLAWIGTVGIGLLLATALAVRDGKPTQSVTHLLHDTEQALADRPVEARGPQTLP